MRHAAFLLDTILLLLFPGQVGDHENYFDDDKYLSESYDNWIKSGTDGTDLTFKYKIDLQHQNGNK